LKVREDEKTLENVGNGRCLLNVECILPNLHSEENDAAVGARQWTIVLDSGNLVFLWQTRFSIGSWPCLDRKRR